MYKLKYKLKLLGEEYKEKFKCEVFLSDIKPRTDQYHQDLEMINSNINSLLRNSNIKRVKHSNIKSQNLHDDRHLKTNRNQGEEMSGVQLFCKNIYETVTQKTIGIELIKKSQWYPCKKLYNKGIQNSRYQNKTLNSYLQHQSQQQIHRRYTYSNNVTHNHPYSNSNNYHNQAPSYYYRLYQQSYIGRLESEV